MTEDVRSCRINDADIQIQNIENIWMRAKDNICHQHGASGVFASYLSRFLNLSHTRKLSHAHNKATLVDAIFCSKMEMHQRALLH